MPGIPARGHRRDQFDSVYSQEKRAEDPERVAARLRRDRPAPLRRPRRVQGPPLRLPGRAPARHPHRTLLPQRSGM